MSTKNNAAREAVQAEPCLKAVVLSRLDMEDLANEALSIGLAVEWIVQANSLLEEIRCAAKDYQEFRAALQKRGIAYNSADWMASEMDQHVSRILTRQQVLIKRMAGGAA